MHHNLSEARVCNASPGTRYLYHPMATRVASAGPPDHSTLTEYVQAFCSAPLARGEVNRLSRMLAHVVASQVETELAARGVTLPIEVGKPTFGGSRARHHLDAWIHEPSRGLMLGLDVKGLNKPQSVQKNWNNRIGDFEQLATHHHRLALNAVLGGVLAVPVEDLSDELLSKIEASMRKRGGRTHTANQQDQLEVTALIVISKQTKEILADVPAKSGVGAATRIESFAPRIAELFVERWL